MNRKTPKPKPKRAKKRPVRGRDWHAWAWQLPNGRFRHNTTYYKTKLGLFAGGEGKWVRVLFVPAGETQ